MKISIEKEKHSIEFSLEEAKQLSALLSNLPPGKMILENGTNRKLDKQNEVFIPPYPTTLATSEDGKTKTPIPKKPPRKKATILAVILAVIVLLVLTVCAFLTDSTETREKIIKLILMIGERIASFFQTLVA